MNIAHRRLRDLYDYWDRKKGARRLPARADIDPADIRHLLPWVGLVEVTRDPQRFCFRLAGSEVEAFYGAKITGRWLDEMDFDNHRTEIVAQYAQAAQSGEPLAATFAFAKADGRYMEYERVLLPLSSDGNETDMLLVGFACDVSFVI